MIKNILILEDDLSQLAVLEKIVADVSSDIHVFAATKVEKAYQLALEHNIDCFMIDIILDTRRPGDTSGLRFVESIRGVGRYYTTPLFFITALEDPMNFAYKELHCLDYIEKPFDAERIKENLKKILLIPEHGRADRILFFRKDGIVYPIRCRDIVFMESVNHIIYIHLSDGDVFEVQYKTCKAVLAEADTVDLVQCSRNTIVNMQYVRNIDLTNRYITMKDGRRVEIGVTFRKKLAGLLGK